MKVFQTGNRLEAATGNGPHTRGPKPALKTSIIAGRRLFWANIIWGDGTERFNTSHDRFQSG